MCFAAYRRKERARRRQAEANHASPGDRAPEAGQRVGEGHAITGTGGIASLTIRFRLGHVLRFQEGQLHPADTQALKRLPAGVHDALVWVAWGGRRP